MRRRAVIAVAVVAVAAGCGVAWALYRSWAAHRPLQWSGTVEADTVDVGSRVAGRIKEVRAREGDVLDAGQVLLVFETGDLDAQRLQAEGQLEQAQAQLDRLEKGGGLAGPRREEIAAAQAHVAAQESVLSKAGVDRRRAEMLFTDGAATRQEVDNARSAQQSATAERNAARAQLDQLVRATPDDVKSAYGQVSAAKGRLAQIDVMLDELEVRVPKRARVETLDLRPGDIIAPNATVARLLEPEQLYIRIYVPETQLGYVRPGLELPVSVDTFPHRTFKAVVESVRHEGEFSPRNLQTADERANQVFATRLQIVEGKEVLRAGMAATAWVKR
jgi:HlyD family secretion protein